MTPEDLNALPNQPLSAAEIFRFDIQPFSVLAAVAVAAAFLYIAGVVRLRSSGRPWLFGRSLSFLVGCGAVILMTASGLEGYGYIMISVFMFQQLTLMMVVPLLLVFGSPGTLLLRATPHNLVGRGILRVALSGLRSRWGRALIHPAVMIPLFLASFYGVYLTGSANALVGSWLGHNLLEVLFLAAGVLFTIPVLSTDPLPRRQSYLGKMVDVLTEIPLHAFFGVILMMASDPLVAVFAERSQAIDVDPVADQMIAGGLAWSYGEAPAVILLVVLVLRWFRDDTTKAKRADREADANGDVDRTAYNAYLHDLHATRDQAPR